MLSQPKRRLAGLLPDPDPKQRVQLMQFRAKVMQYLSEAGPDAPDAMDQLERRAEERGMLDLAQDNRPRRTSPRTFVEDLTNPGNPRVMPNLMQVILELEETQHQPIPQLSPEIVAEM